ncbi:hypothetical protein E3A20_29460, partial [Planctomyces bekefii]
EEETIGATCGKYVELGGKDRLKSVTYKILDRTPLGKEDIQWVDAVRELGLLPGQSSAVTNAAQSLLRVEASRE